MSFEAILISAIIILFDFVFRLLFYKKIEKEIAKRDDYIRREPTPSPKPRPKIRVSPRLKRRKRKFDQQFIRSVQKIIDKEIDLFGEDIKIDKKLRIPDTRYIPIENPKQWFKIEKIICCFVDMKGSTKLTATITDDETIARIYRLFTETAIRIFNQFESSYIDIKGDGVFALFNSEQPHTALAATITFKTFVYDCFTPKILIETGQEISGHYGIDQADVLVRKFGLKKYNDRTDRQNEVWAGQPVNMAAKLASSSDGNELRVSDRFFERLNLENLNYIEWKPTIVASDKRFSFTTAYVIYANWSTLDGESQCKKLRKLDQQQGMQRFLRPVYALIDFWKSKVKEMQD